MRSVRVKRGQEVGLEREVGEAVDERRASRIWEPVEDKAKIIIGSWETSGLDEEGEVVGKSKLLMSFRRNVILVVVSVSLDFVLGFQAVVVREVGRSAAWMICEVVV